MKRLIVLFSFLVIFLSGSAEFKAKYVFCELVGVVKMNDRLDIYVDFGDNESHDEKSLLVDEEGNEVEFTSMVDALNFMGMHVWEFVQAYTITHMNTNVYHFMMKKPYLELDPEVQKLYNWN